MQEIICLLDASGSMSSCEKDATGGFNQFLKDQQEIGDAHLTAIWFDNNFEVFYDGMLSKAEPINKWKVRGSTALYDAICKVFEYTRERFTKESPEKVIFAILTDGEENSSKKFTKDDASKLISEHQTKYGWEVVFLGANQDVWLAARDLSINVNNVIAYNSANTAQGMRSYSDIISNLRSGIIS